MPLPRSRQFLASAIAASAALTLSAVAAPQTQTPPPASAPGGQGQAPAAGAPPQGRGAAPAPGGRGAGGGRGPAMWEPDFSKKPPVVALSPAEQQKKFWLPPGFKIEPVLTDPDIQEPGQIAFDGNGRMFVVELRGYMQDADATGELDPMGRISVHEDKNNDGMYETHGVFVDSLIFPRFVMPFGANAILAKESNADEVWKYTDTEQRQQRRQERALRDRHGPAAERRASGERPVLGARQLAVQHDQSRPAQVDADRRAARADRHRTAGSGARRRTTTARSGSRPARAACPATFSCRWPTATSAIRSSSNPTSTSPGARPCSSPTCRAG